MPLYRCQNPDCTEDPHERLIYDFEADAPICPKCGADSRLPEFANTIIPREVLHFLIKDKAGPVVGMGSRYRAACDPTLKLGPKVRATGEATACTCKACQASQDFPAGARPLAVVAKADFPVEVDRAAGVIRANPGGCGCK